MNKEVAENYQASIRRANRDYRQAVNEAYRSAIGDDALLQITQLRELKAQAEAEVAKSEPAIDGDAERMIMENYEIEG